MPTFERVKSGLPGLDHIVDSIRMGDNVVWQLDNLEDYGFFLRPFVGQAVADRRSIHYMRFADHPPLLAEMPGLRVWQLNPHEGFENFTVKVHEIIAEQGPDAFYVFDALSELQTAWASDLMMGCFFQVTCPYLFELNTVAYFGMLRNRHSFDAIARVRDTTQLMLDVFRDGAAMFVQPLKAWKRYSTTMFMPHRLSEDGSDAKALTDPVEAGRFYAVLNRSGISPVECSLDHWDRMCLEARQELASGVESPATRHRLCAMLLGRASRITELAERNFTSGDLLMIEERMIGSGSVGGKAAGMLLARKIVENRMPELTARLEPHDSFYVGADVFYSFLVENGWWKLRLAQRSHDGFFPAAAELGEKIRSGRFPECLRERFRRMLDYFGQSPIIVRSSSLLEDGFGNAFAGKYVSVFCVNSGTPEERLAELEESIREVYASAMNESALTYRRQRHLDDCDEQMAILVQRVSGANYAGFFMPAAAGVGYSYNSYVWNDAIDPAAGMLRLVAGLGTRAVNRVDSDYPRLVSLDNPRMMPVAGDDERVRFSQHEVDVLDIARNTLEPVELEQAIPHFPYWLRDILCDHDVAAESYFRETGSPRSVYYCSCGEVAANSAFIADMRSMLRTLQDAYEYPVDIEFTVNFSEAGDYVINLLQCRPLQTADGRGAAVKVEELPPERLYFALDGNTMGGGVELVFDYVVAVDPKAYYDLNQTGKYAVARIVGALNRKLAEQNARVMLAGPGRWATSSPELGVPVNFAEISNMAAICELSCEGLHIMPELSYGSHFFQDLVETGMFYAAVFEGHPGCAYNRDLFAAEPDRIGEFVDAAADVGAGAVRVYDVRGRSFILRSDLITRRTVCGFSTPRKARRRK